MLKRFFEICSKVRNNKNPLKFLISRILMRLKLSHFIIIERHGYKIRFFRSYMSRHCYDSQNYFRQEEENFLSRYLRKGDVYVDVGANIGLLSLKASSIVGETGKVYAFEPVPRIFNILQKNTKYNGFTNIVLNNCALGDSCGVVNMTDIESDDSINSIIPSSSKRVALRTLDGVLDNYLGKINLLKVDVEGYELFVFRGGEKVLKLTECIFFESWETHSKKYHYTSKDLFEILFRADFKIYKLNGECINELTSNYVSFNCEDLIAVKNIEKFKERYYSNNQEIKN